MRDPDRSYSHVICSFFWMPLVDEIRVIRASMMYLISPQHASEPTHPYRMWLVRTLTTLKMIQLRCTLRPFLELAISQEQVCRQSFHYHAWQALASCTYSSMLCSLIGSVITRRKKMKMMRKRKNPRKARRKRLPPRTGFGEKCDCCPKIY